MFFFHDIAGLDESQFHQQFAGKNEQELGGMLIASIRGKAYWAKHKFFAVRAAAGLTAVCVVVMVGTMALGTPSPKSDSLVNKTQIEDIKRSTDQRIGDLRHQISSLSQHHNATTANALVNELQQLKAAVSTLESDVNAKFESLKKAIDNTQRKANP